MEEKPECAARMKMNESEKTIIVPNFGVNCDCVLITVKRNCKQHDKFKFSFIGNVKNVLIDSDSTAVGT